MSTEMKHDGGPAFPQRTEGDWSVQQFEGLSMRDYFAGQALAGLLSSLGDKMLGHQAALEYGRHSTSPPNAAFHAYQFADAMLEAREQ